MRVGPIQVDQAKYTFQIPEGEWRVQVLRYGEPWLFIEQGHNAIHSLMNEVIYLQGELEAARVQIDELKETINVP